MKNTIPAYVINLPQERARKEHICKNLAPYAWLDVQFIDGVDGRLIPEPDYKLYGFDLHASFKRYGRKLNPGEIGCVLSHFKCYRTLLESTEEYALILEDDITILRDIEVIQKLVGHINNETPTILFLSGDYWYKSLKHIGDESYIASVFDAVGAYAYIINRKAAEIILKKNSPITCVSDNWSIYRTQGVKLRAAYPYLIDANIENFESTIQQSYWGEIRSRMGFSHRMNSYYNGLIKRILLAGGHFVSKIRKDV